MDDAAIDKAMTTMVIIGSSPLERACMVAGLSGIPRMRATSCDSPAQHDGQPPQLVLLQEQPGMRSTWLYDQIVAVRGAWPNALIIVVGTGAPDGADLCMRLGVNAYLPQQIGSNQIIAVIDLLVSGLVVYPTDTLADIAVRARPAASRRIHPIGVPA